MPRPHVGGLQRLGCVAIEIAPTRIDAGIAPGRAPAWLPIVGGDEACLRLCAHEPQNPRVEAREALNILSQSVRGLDYEAHPPRLQIVFKENIPES